MQPEMKIDPQKVRSAREHLGWSQERLSQAAGVGLRTIQRLESEGTASKETILCISAALQTTPSDISIQDGKSSSAMSHIPTGAPWYVRYGLYGIYTPKAALGFMWLCLCLSAVSFVLGFLNPILWLGCMFTLAALWYWAAAHWLTHHDGWSMKNAA